MKIEVKKSFDFKIEYPILILEGTRNDGTYCSRAIGFTIDAEEMASSLTFALNELLHQMES